MPIPRQTEKVQHQTAKDIVFTNVLEWIVTGVLTPGEKIIDTDLAAYFSVSRTPVREALQSLAELELVEIIPSYGTKVTSINWDDVKQNYQILTELQAFAARLAVPHITAEDIAELENINARFAKATEDKDPRERIRCDEDFHRLIIRRAGNKYLTQYLNQLMHRTRRIQYIFFGETLFKGASVEQHARIIECLKAKDLEGTVRTTVENWQASADKAQAIYEAMEE
ncbi:MAG: GntR family transcriptional regulator [Firmicutes bacterium]|nr:GntR family transcriptional regulator [Bacillota bacterium]